MRGEKTLWTYNYSQPSELAHHGVKGQKWGVRNGPPYPIKRDNVKVEKTEKLGIIKSTSSGHDSNPRNSIPNSIMDHIAADGKVDVRTFYDDAGWKAREIHTTNHGNPKRHPFGEHGEHIERYEWNPDGTLKSLERGELNDSERKENSDIV